MSRESITWLNENVLMGFVNDREKWAANVYAGPRGGDVVRPWFATPEYANGYEGPVPIEAVEHLFRHEVIEGQVFSYVPCDITEADFMDEDGRPFHKVEDPTRKAIIHPVTHEFFYVPKEGYQPHQFNDWLVNNVGNLIDDDVPIDSAGLLKGGAVAWVSLSLPDTIETNVGFGIRPRLLAFTAHNGQYVTTYKRSLHAPVCDNSLMAEVWRDRHDGNAMEWRVKHTSQSNLAIADAREALGILHAEADDMVEFIDKLAEWEVSNREYKQVLNKIVPVPEKIIDGGKVTNQRAINNADRKRSDITSMYVRDDRAAPWQGTALGVLQAFNTWDQQVREFKSGREHRKLIATLDGEVDKFDGMVMTTLSDVTGVDPAELFAGAAV